MNDPRPSSPSQLTNSANNWEHSKVRYLDASQAWYVVHCKPNSEKTALLNLKNQGFFPFLPLQKVTFRKGAAFQTKLRPLFPGYMFVAQKPTSSNWHKINNTRGVVRLVTLTAEPTPVPPIIMNQNICSL